MASSRPAALRVKFKLQVKRQWRPLVACAKSLLTLMLLAVFAAVRQLKEEDHRTPLQDASVGFGSVGSASPLASLAQTPLASDATDGNLQSLTRSLMEEVAIPRLAGDAHQDGRSNDISGNSFPFGDHRRKLRNTLGRSLSGMSSPSSSLSPTASKNSNKKPSSHPKTTVLSPCDIAVRLPTSPKKCQKVRKSCPPEEDAMVDYTVLRYCGPLGGVGTTTLLVVLVALFFYILGDTVDDYFCPVLQWLADAWNLSPSTAGVTLLALGNGAPDAFSSLAAFKGDSQAAQSDMADATALGLGAIISGGGFVSAFVLGAVACTSSPFHVERLPFVRDVSFYLVATLGVFYGFVKRGYATLHTSAACLAFYAIYATVVVVGERFRRDGGKDADGGGGKESTAAAGDGDGDGDGNAAAGDIIPANGCRSSSSTPLWIALLETANAPLTPNMVLALRERGLGRMNWEQMAHVLAAALYLPITLVRRCTIPIGASEPRRWDSRLDAVAVVLGPMVLLVFQQFVSPNLVVLRLPLPHAAAADAHDTLDVPLWFVVLLQSSTLGWFFYQMVSHADLNTKADDVRHPVGSLQTLLVALSFCTSIAWISLAARELLGCLRALGLAFGVSSQVLGLTVLAWGNSVGDLVADVAIARSGEPNMAVAGCYAGPMFNLLVGMGGALTIACANSPSGRLALPMSPNVPVSFGFLFAGLAGSLLSVPLSGYRLTFPWGICLMVLYLTFVVTSVIVELS
ncbi:sodium/calcium exchanger membrane region domain-containing protein [Pseudoscourfieldia marina]